jgi:hypothetical protein
MPAQLHIVERPDSRWDFIGDPGAMWRAPEHDRSPGDPLCPEGREAWYVVLPNRAGLWWTTLESWEKATDTEPAHPSGKLWTVEGEPPNITVTPSIDAGENDKPHGWHGHINNGVMTP